MQNPPTTYPSTRPATRLRASWLQGVGAFLLLTLVFSLGYTQSPLYTSNQNQYFLHGAAQAGLGFLKADWLANTFDPTPVFSLLAYLTYRFLHYPAFFYLYYALLMGIYIYSLFGITTLLFPLRSSQAKTLAFLALLITGNSAALRFGLSRAIGDNWTYLLEDGVADQRLLGPVFQPSTFGALLLLSIWLFLRHKPYWAVLCAVLAATFHPTYLLSAAVLTFAYMLVTFREERSGCSQGKPWLQPLLIGLLALALVLPIVGYVYVHFRANPAGTAAQAQKILVNFRIPHHTQVSQWLDITAIIKILLAGAAIILVRKQRIFMILLVPFLAAIGLTLLQVGVHSNSLALIFPWRISTFLVPLATALLLGALVSKVLDWPALQAQRLQNWISGLSLALLTLVVLVGLARLYLDFGRQANGNERPLFAYAAAHHAPGEIYLTPTKMQDFRLATGSPVYIDFKSIPYQDQDVLEWYRRVQTADRFYKTGDCALLAELANKEGVTHVVLNKEQFGFACPILHEEYRDQNHALYVLKQ